jgi:autotransporter-associated beta strand protein
MSSIFRARLLSGLIVILAVLVALPSNAPAASKLWGGSANGNFSTPGNWVGSIGPVAGDDLVFQSNNLVTRFLVTNDLSPNRAFNSITIQGSNYIIRGNAILLTNGITTVNTSGTNRIDADVDVRGSQAWEAAGALSVFHVNGNINLNTSTLTVRARPGDFYFSGIISGTGNLVKTNVGTLLLNGAGHNTYSGLTRLDGGVLELDKSSITPASNYIAISGDLIIGDGNGLPLTDVCLLLANDQIANTANVTVKDSGLFDLDDYNDQIGALTMQGGTIDTGTGTLFLGGNLTTLSDANTAFIEGHLSLGGASRIFDVAPGPPAADLRINAVISGDAASLFAVAGFTKEGAGTLFLAGTNTYNGTTTINNGQVAVLTDCALGATTNASGAAAPTVVNAKGNLFLNNVQVTNENLTINSSNSGGAFNANGASVWTGDILLNADTFIASSGSLLLNGAITGSGGFTKLSAGSLTLAGLNANTYTGTTTVRDGTLLLDKTPADGAMSGPLVIGEPELPDQTDIVRHLRASQLPDDTDITINASGLLDLNDLLETTGAIGGPGVIDLGSGTLRAGANNGSSTFDGLIIGSGTLFKLGAGTWTLNSDNTYTGQTTVSAGTLAINGSQPQSPVTVNSTATLGGHGVVGNVDVHGNLRPGSSPALLTCSDIVFHSSAADYLVELNGFAPGSGYDQLRAQGKVALSNATLHVTLGFTSSLGSTFTIIDNDGSDAVTNTFNGLPQGATVFGNGIPFQISYTGGSGNDVVLTQLADWPRLKIQRSGNTNVVLLWPTNFSGFTLEANTNLNTNIWSAVSPAPIISSSNNVVTDSATQPRSLYRLRNP